MRKIHVITQKELVDSEQIQDCTAVVIDVFLATSTIVFLLKNNIEPIYTTANIESARNLALKLNSPFIMLGESKGETVEGFMYPDPTLVSHSEQQKAAILCSTNGTIAIDNAKGAKKLYVSSLVNGHLVAKKLHEQGDDSSIVLVCSGNDKRFSMEDFIGAGHVIENIITLGDYFLSDAAKIAREAYQQSKLNKFANLFNCETKHLLDRYNFKESVEFVLDNFESVNVLPVLVDGKIINEHA